MRRLEACPACGAGFPTVVVAANTDQRRRFLRLSAAKYGGVMDGWLAELDLVVLRCPECGHHWYRDQPEEDQLAAMYEAGRSLYGPPEVSREPSAHMRREMRRLRRLFGTGAPIRLLDYGSGFGRWARAAAAEGFAVCAYEPSLVRGREPIDVPFERVTDRAALAGRRFHAINLEQVLEHVADPQRLLIGVAPLLEPHAVVRITVPDIERPFEGRAVWASWPFDDRRVHTLAPFEHLHGFTPTSLLRLVRNAGLRPLPLRRAGRSASLWLRQLAALSSTWLRRTYLLAEPGT